MNIQVCIFHTNRRWPLFTIAMSILEVAKFLCTADERCFSVFPLCPVKRLHPFGDATAGIEPTPQPVKRLDNLTGANIHIFSDTEIQKNKD